MSRPNNRSQLMDRLGAVQANTVWAWCGVNDTEKKVYFSIWTDNSLTHRGEKAYVIQEPDWGIDDRGTRSPARNDQDSKLHLVFAAGYEPHGYFIVAKNPKAHPREIAETRTSFVVKLEMDRLADGTVVGMLRERIEIR